MITKNNNGFTLVELIIVITILAILSTIAFVNFSGYVSESEDTKNLVEINQLEKGIGIYLVSNNVLPKPKNEFTYNAGLNKIYSGDIDNELMSLFKINGSNNSYKYSIFNNGEYFQVGGFINKDISYNFIPKTYASADYAVVKGNYLFNPTVPSLLISSGSNNIYNSDNCFLVNGQVNNIDGSCLKKSDLNLGQFDKSLIGYWDMESYYQTSYSGASNVLFLKDLSGNNYDMYMYKFNSTKNDPVSILNTSSGSIFFQDDNGVGIKFDGNNFKYGFTTIEKNKSFDYNGRKVKPIPGNIIFKSTENQDTNINKGISAITLFDYSPIANGNKRIFGFNINNSFDIKTGDTLKVVDTSFYRISGNNIQKHITPYNDGNAGTSYIYGDVGCGNLNLTLDSGDGCWTDEFNSFDNINLSGKNILISNIDFKEKKYCLYLNGKKISCENITQNTIDRLTSDGYNEMIVGISNGIENFNGIIYDTKIYNKILSDDEIKQNSKLLGF